MNIKQGIRCTFVAMMLASVSAASHDKEIQSDPELTYKAYQPKPKDKVISRAAYKDKLHGFWLAQSIANWTGLMTEGDRNEAPFYTDADWGTLDHPNTWGGYRSHFAYIDYFLVEKDRVWGSDDDTDIEYMYQHLLDQNNTSILTGEQIRAGWLKHIYSNEDARIDNDSFSRENHLWVSNEKAYYLMKDKGLVPPATSEPEYNDKYDMIDAQLTTEIFGLFAPGRPDLALKMAHLPIRTTAKDEAAWIAQFYVVMHALAAKVDVSLSIKEQTQWMAAQARTYLPEGSYPAAMYDFVKAHYDRNPDKDNWEAARDAVYQTYQIEGAAGYRYKELFDAGINFASSMVSLFYGEGDLKRTIRIGSLTGWDSDNPTATWSGLIGFMIGKEGVEKAFNNNKLSELYWIHRTRRAFPDRTSDKMGEDTFSMMAQRGLFVIDRAILEEMKGGVNLQEDLWYIPAAN
ncbi:ADP-ribosylglycohydrolase family protein [Temperatibacter marinus]|uniref:ADP-ribosylglycohydrolase family protein n=1 Tax=Temperatibacter marinus TaxID=1456591 RepID=A0AA52EEP8_9PROT|nr:ADP-ribosylglycohydrolase family protein [Temperatibacter marinus]WND01713.1 ADP-ribosylglycohydrolase family protein [Temperatibacter marinus]